MNFVTFITDAPLWLAILLGLIYLALWTAFAVLMLKLWQSKYR